MVVLILGYALENGPYIVQYEIQIILKLHNLGFSHHRLCVRFTKTSETEAFSSSKPDSMVLDPSGDANAIEMAPTLVFRINVQGLFNKRNGW